MFVFSDVEVSRCSLERKRKENIECDGVKLIGKGEPDSALSLGYDMMKGSSVIPT